MLDFTVLDTLKIGENTSVLVEGHAKHFSNGIWITDEDGKIYKVLSVGMPASVGMDIEKVLSTTSLLVKGEFSSKRIFV